MPRPAAPLIYERFTEGSRFALVMAESPEGYLRFGYRSTNEAQRILTTYPTSGLYRADEPSEALLRFDTRLEPEDVVAFFEEEDSVYLVVQDFGTIRFYRDGRLLRKLGDEHYREWIHNPWHYVVFPPGSCDSLSLVNVIADEPQRIVTVESIDGAKFRYDTRSGRLFEVERPELMRAERASPNEGVLAELLMEEFAPGDGASSLSGPELIADAWIASCSDVVRADVGRPRDLFEDEQVEPGESRALGIDTHRGHRLRHALEERIDLYSIAPGLGAHFLCGGAGSPDELKEGLTELFKEDDMQGLVEPIRNALLGATVAAMTTWKTDAFQEEGADWIGIATLWSFATGEWRMIMANKFVVPSGSW